MPIFGTKRQDRTGKATGSKGVSTTKAQAPATKEPAKKSPATSTAKKAPATKEPAKKSPATPKAKKAPAIKEPAKKSPATSKAKKAAATKEPAKKSPATKEPASTAASLAVTLPAKEEKAPTPSRPAILVTGGVEKATPPRKGEGVPGVDDKFLAEQRLLLEAERLTYLEQAQRLREEADALAEEKEPGEAQFDEESGEGGTGNIDREVDLMLSAQALGEVEEIDHALAKIEDKVYGACESCYQPIPKARLKAIPQARLCVACKSGSLVARR